MKIKNLDKAAKRIQKAVKNKEKIIIYGDSDLDGIASVIIAKEAIINLKGNIVKICFPKREQGYGINKESLQGIKKQAPALLIAFDFGISNFEEVKLANEFGFEVIIIDHHQILDKLPEPAIIVNPKQTGDKYLFKELAAAGLSYYLALELLKNTKSLKNGFLELAALATISDMMPIEKDNKEIVFQGLDLVYSSWRPGIQALLKVFEKEYGLVKINKINSLLNIRDNTQEYPIAYTLLTCSDKKKAEEIAKDLFKQSVEKKIKIKDILLDVEERMEKKSLPIVFEGDKSWELPLLGTVASLIANKHSKPVFLYKDKDKIQGVIRATQGFDVVKAMKQSADILKDYGGHARAAGFSLDKENLKKFYNNLIKYYS
ncbi:MAG: DHH family phosphoesterase [Candidatus Pacebacteria bacterium]|nr:DHH family phosphoesterase [Candidatus Paceibacterota bacterium]